MSLDRDELTRLAQVVGGVLVLGCLANSASARAGVRYGDIVLSIDGHRTPDWATFIEVRGRCRGTMTLEVFRQGETITIVVDLAAAAQPLDPPSVLSEILSQRIVPVAAANDAWTPRMVTESN